jgi:hydrogenase maturation factor
MTLSSRDAGPGCVAEPGCITCGDVAVAMTVSAVVGVDALCRDDQGREEQVATELVGPVTPGDSVLVHAGVAIERLATGAAEPAAARRG